jgi:hypothetical protein
MKRYRSNLTASINRKGVLDIDAYKGCDMGVAKYGENGCYGLCYAAKVAKLNGFNFANGSRRSLQRNSHQGSMFCKLGKRAIYNMVKAHYLDWFRIGTMGDPSHSWDDTADICEWLGHLKTPVIVTKHWIKCEEIVLKRILKSGAVLNTSISALDGDREILNRIEEHNRFSKAGIRSVFRIVSCKFGDTENGSILAERQKRLFSMGKSIDNPLRIGASDQRVLCGDIVVSRVTDMNTKTWISVNNKSAYIGICKNCPDQCGLLL